MFVETVLIVTKIYGAVKWRSSRKELMLLFNIENKFLRILFDVTRLIKVRK